MASEIWHSTFLSVDFQPIKRFTKADCINHRYFLAVQSFGNKTTLDNCHYRLLSKSTCGDSCKEKNPAEQFLRTTRYLLSLTV